MSAVCHNELSTMNKLDDKRERGRVRPWDKDIAELAVGQTPEKRAYLIIRYFFESQNTSEEMCRKFKEWFAGEDA